MWGILLSLPLGAAWTKTEAYAHGSVGIIGRVEASDKVCTMPSQGYFFFTCHPFEPQEADRLTSYQTVLSRENKSLI